MSVTILVGDCRERLRELPDESVHCVVTSPPYWGLRDYGTSRWEGGSADCDHIEFYPSRGSSTLTSAGIGQTDEGAAYQSKKRQYKGNCKKCGATRIDAQIGLEATLEAWVAEMVAVFREVRRVLRGDGTLWLNLGDGYYNGGAEKRDGGHGFVDGGRKKLEAAKGALLSPKHHVAGLKPKDLLMMPARVALALQADGWYLRSDIVWCLSGGAWLYARTQKGEGPMMLKDLVRLMPQSVELWTGERWSVVRRWTKHEGREGGYELVLRSGERIGCTAKHVWPVVDRGNVCTDLLQVGDVIQRTELPSGGKARGWLIDKAFWFAGLYLAEGSRSGDTIQISGHVRERERWEKIRLLAVHYGASARLYEKGKTQIIHIDQAAALNAVLRVLIGGKTAKDKHLTMAAWRYPDQALRMLAEGYLEGDGHDDGQRIRLGFTRNYALERDLRCLAARLGATVVLKPTFARNKQGRYPSFRGEWRWHRRGHHNERDPGEIVEIRKSRARQFWDVSVSDHPHLFALASGVLTHNSKPNPMPESVTDRPTSAHEHVFLLAKSARYWYDADAVREAHKRLWGESNGGSWSHTERFPIGSKQGHHSGSYPLPDPRGRNIRNVWTIPTAPFSEAHFATFPPALVEPCIKAGCPEGGTVLDPFGGAGTVGLVADRLQRDAILIELNPEYAAMARRRIDGDVPLLATVA